MNLLAFFTKSYTVLLLFSIATINCQAPCNDAGPQSLSLAEQARLTRRSWIKHLASTHYDRHMTPDWPGHTNISVHVWPFNVGHVDEFRQTVRVGNGVSLVWLDQRLAFPPNASCADFPLRDRFYILTTTPGEALEQIIWVPLIQLNDRQESSSTPFLKLIALEAWPDGHVEFTAKFNEVRTCSIQTRRFPFDTQNCPITLEVYQLAWLRHDVKRSTWSAENAINSFTRRDNQLKVMWTTNEWQMYATEDHIWQTTMNATHLYGVPYTITFPMLLTRSNLLQHVVNLIASPVVLSLSSTVGLYRGCRVGERFGYGGTTVVAMTLMINELRTVLGISADGFPILYLMYIGLDLTLILATLLSGLPLRLSIAAKKERIAQLKSRNAITTVATVAKEIAAMNSKKNNKSAIFGTGCFLRLRQMYKRWFENLNSNAYDWAFMILILTLQTIVVLVCVLLWTF